MVMLLLGALVTPASPATAEDVPVHEESLRIAGTPEADGSPAELDVSILTTDQDQARPAVVLAHGFGGTKADSLSAGRTLARAGYTVITYTARGFGKSGGSIHLDHPDFEGRDAIKIIDLAAGRPEVRKDGGDPVIGFAGGSYGGAISLMAAGLDQRVDAIVPAFTWHSLSQALFPQYASTGAPQSPAGLSPIDETGVFKQRWAALFFLGAAGAGSAAGPGGACGRFSPELCAGYTKTATTGRPDPALIELLDASSTAPLLPKITAPTLILHGEQDTLFPLDHADANFLGLPDNTPAAMRWVSGGHDSVIALDDLLPEVTDWFDRYLDPSRPEPSPSRPESSPSRPERVEGFSYVIPETALVGRPDDDSEAERFDLPAYPGRGGPFDTDEIRLTGEPQTMISPPGGSPAAMTSLPGTGTGLSGLQTAAGYGLAVLPGQSATFTSAPLDEPRTVVGSGTANLSVTSSTSTATLFIALWDLGPERDDGQPSTATLPQRTVAPLHLTGLTPGTTKTVQVTLPPVAHRVPVDHRIQLVVSSTDQAYAVPNEAASYTISMDQAGALDQAGVLTLPRVAGTAVESTNLDVPWPLVLVVAGLLIAALIAAVVLWLRRRVVPVRPELRDTPLVVEDLVKTYGDGFKAVDGVSFGAERGQVVGLLGPNGAGKTTTLRMMVGLIRPDSGTVLVAGQSIHPGADVLGSVGALIEGPGFLPHLTGLQNLNVYWEATGRPPEEAHLEEALEIAGLGSAIDRRVLGYSQGMRQRLGIAQAMLGLPELLLLDEPTNGLDPPQIKEMRRVLEEYAASGRTVVVSSHLLAEVEQTCSHVVVMHQGEVILSGAVSDLTATEDVTMIGFAPGTDVDSAARVVQDLELYANVSTEGLRVHGPLPRAEVVRALVNAGFMIDSVDGHRQLEEVFMRLVLPDSAGDDQRAEEVADA